MTLWWANVEFGVQIVTAYFLGSKTGGCPAVQEQQQIEALKGVFIK